MSITQLSWCHGTSELRKTKFIWTIQNFSTRYIATGELLRSTIFYTGRNYKDQWRLLLFPKGQCEREKDFVGIYLELIRSVEPHIKADVIFSIVKPGTDETTRDRKLASRVFLQKCKHGVRKMINFSEILTYMKDDTLKICCEIMPFVSYSSPLSELSTTKPENVESTTASAEVLEEPVTLPPRLCDHLWMQFHSSTNSNLVITVESQHFHVHKFILQVRSPVFAAMFECDAKESPVNEIVIDGFKAEVVSKMLQFIYTDRIDDFEEIAKDLLVAADIYALDGLRASCERVLCEQVAISNAVATLILAENCTSKFLKNHVAKFISDNLPRIINTSDYKEMERIHPELVFYLVRMIASQMVKH